MPDDAPAANPLTVDAPARALSTLDGETADPLRRLMLPAGGTPAADLVDGSSVGFKLQGELGRGGMGVVYQARDTDLDREVAVKVLAVGLPAARFFDEARITGQLQHPGIPAVHDLGTLPDGRPFLAMKLIRGDTLADLLAGRQRERPEFGRFVAVFEQIAHAVAYAHAHGVVHRDLKPANVMVGAFNEVQVMDWGLAKVLASGGRQPPGSPDDPDATRDPDPTTIKSLRDAETQAGSILGTPAFMPPEQAIGAVKNIDARSDVFGLGAILAVILTGQPPFVGESSEATRQLAALGQVADCFARLDGCGAEPELVALCKRCLSPDPADRPADAKEVATAVAALRAASDDRARRAEVQAAEQQARRRVVQWAAVVTAAVLLAGVVGTTAGLLQARAAQEAEGRRADGEERAKELADTRRQEAEASNADLWAGLDAMTAGVAGDSLGSQKAVSEEQKKFLAGVLPLYQKLAGKKGHDEATRARVARSAFRVGLIEYRLGRHAESTAAYQMARDDFAALAADFPAVPEYLFAQARTHANLGNLLADRGDRAGAEEHYRRGLELFERLADDFPTSPEYRSALATGHVNLGVVVKGLGDGRRAEDHYRQGLVLREKLAADFPAVPAHRADLAWTHVNLGNLLAARQDRPAAEREYRQGLGVFEKLVADFPTVPEYRSDLAWCHGNLGSLLTERGNPGGRRKSTGKAWRCRKSWRPTSRPCPGIASTWPGLASTWRACWPGSVTGRGRRNSTAAG